MITSDWIAVGAVLISLLMEGTAVIVVIRLVGLTWNVTRHRHQLAPVPLAVNFLPSSWYRGGHLHAPGGGR